MDVCCFSTARREHTELAGAGGPIGSHLDPREAAAGSYRRPRARVTIGAGAGE